MCGEQELRNRVYPQNQCENNQEIEELGKICCEEANQVKDYKLRIVSETRERSQYCERIAEANSRISRSSEFSRRGKFAILTQRAAQRYRTFPDNQQLFQVQEKCLAAILECRLPHGTPQVHQDTSLRAQQLQKDLPQLFSETRELRFLRILVFMVTEPSKPWGK